MMFWLLFLVSAVAADWPPMDCPAPITVSDDVLVLSSYRTRNIDTKCELDDLYSDVVFMQFGRHYKHSVAPAARMNIEFMFGDVLQFDINIASERLTVGSIEDSKGCDAVLSSNTDDWRSWMRIRVNHLREVAKTFVSIDLKSSSDLHFMPCARFEIKYTEPFFRLNVGAYVESDVNQEIYLITTDMPNFNVEEVNTDKRLSRLEHKVSRLQNTLSLYMSYHDEHVTKTAAQTTSLREYTTMTKNRIKHSSKTHLFFWVFLVGLAATGICAYTNLKIKHEKRWHLL